MYQLIDKRRLSSESDTTGVVYCSVCSFCCPVLVITNTTGGLSFIFLGAGIYQSDILAISRCFTYTSRTSPVLVGVQL